MRASIRSAGGRGAAALTDIEAHLLPALAGAAAGGLPVLGAAGVKALLDRRDKLREIKDNQLYFYYRVGERLGTRLG